MANTNYKRHDKNNNEVSMAGKSVIRAAFGANEGWTDRVYLNWNGAYQAQKVVQAIPAYDETRFKNVLSFTTSATSGLIDEVEVGMYCRGRGITEGTQITAINKDPANYPNYWTVTMSNTLDLDGSMTAQGIDPIIRGGIDPVTFYKNRTPGTYQARNADNSPRTPAAYQRHDKDNNPVTG